MRALEKSEFIKILFWILIPVLWVFIFMGIFKFVEDVVFSGILALIALAGFIGLFINIFVQIHKIDKSAHKKQISQKDGIFQKKSFWIFLIMVITLSYIFRYIFNNSQINIYLQISLWVIYLIIIYIIYRKIERNK